MKHVRVFTILFQIPLRACLNFAQVYFENCFRGYFSDFIRRIAGYLTHKIGETDRKQTQKKPDNITLLENLNRL